MIFTPASKGFIIIFLETDVDSPEIVIPVFPGIREIVIPKICKKRFEVISQDLADLSQQVGVSGNYFLFASPSKGDGSSVKIP